MISKAIKFLIISILVLFSLSIAHASPQGGQVVHGNADIFQSGGDTSINQYSDKAIINWGSFDIGSGERVDFKQPGSGSVVLNRVTGGNPSEIYGRLTGNGSIFLINQNGLVIGKGASVEAGSFLGGAAAISDKDFIDGRYLFGGALGEVVNRGDIRVNGRGFAALIGGKVSNEGFISARLGKTVLASGESFRLDFDGSGLIGIEVDKGISGAYASNSGILEGASVIMTTGAASDILAGAVNNSGVIKASGIYEEGGKVVLTGGGVVQSGVIDASGVSGGSVYIEGAEYVSAEAGSLISADGEAAGGEIKLLSGGDVHFKSGAEAHARSVYGDGGFIEVSGKRVSAKGMADTRSVYGKKGGFLIDPTDIVIMKDAPSGSLEGDFTVPGGSDISYIDMDYLNGQLSLSDVTISTVGTSGNGRGDISVAGGAGSLISGSGLTLRAAGDILIANEGINLTGGLTLEAGGSVSSSAALNASYLKASASGSVIDISNIGNVGSVSAESASGNVSLSGVADLNISSAYGRQVFIKAAGKLTGEGISGYTANMSSGGDMDVKISSGRVNASSGAGSVNIENSYTGKVYLDSVTANGGDIAYFQSGGDVVIDSNIDAGGGFIGITNGSGGIYADFDFAADLSKNMLLKGAGVYLSKSGDGAADIGASLMGRIDASLLDIKASGDINVSDAIDKPGTSLYLTSAGGAVNSGSNRITVSRLDINAFGDINVVTDVEKGSLVSSGGGINVSEKDGAIFELLSAAESGVSVNVENAGDLRINSILSKDPVNIRTADGVNTYVRGGEKDMAFNLENGADNNISVENGGSLTVSAINAPGIKELSLVSENGNIIMPGNSLAVADRITLKGKNINDGSGFSLTSKEIILHIDGGGLFGINAQKADISGGRFVLSLAGDISFEDLDNDKNAIKAEYFKADSSGAVFLANKASAGSFIVNSGSFILSSFDSSVRAVNIDIRTSGDISGTGRLSASDIYLEAMKIGVDSSILVDAGRAVLKARGPFGEKTVNIAAPDRFSAIKSYMFLTDGTAYLNGVPVDKRLYFLIQKAGLYNFFPFEDKNIGTGYNLLAGEAKRAESDMITLTWPEGHGASAISDRNGKPELR